MSNPLEGRAGLQSMPAELSPMALELGRFRRKFGLVGCVLLSFKGDRVGVNSSGMNDEFGAAMVALGDEILAAFDDGQFDPK